MREGKTAQGNRRVTEADQQVAIGRHRRLHDAVALRIRVCPQHRAGVRRHADRRAAAHEEHLLDAVDRQQVRRTVAVAARRPRPFKGAGTVIGGEGAHHRDDHPVADHQRRAAEPPGQAGRVGIRRRIVRPAHSTGLGVEGIEDTGSAEGVDRIAADRRRRARSRAGVGIPEARPPPPPPPRVPVHPHQATGGRLIAGDDFILTVLLLGIQPVAIDRARGTGRPDRTSPDEHGRRRLPVGGNLHSADNSVARGSAETGPTGAGPERGCRRGVVGRGGVGLTQQHLLGHLRPAPVHEGVAVAIQAIRSHEQPRAAEQRE